ncbi:MAG: CarD family transcriptional regulator [Spirochaetaceae bacterium]|nr:CarD family transcriptional regulator [Spirochaetaceae bacterium]MBQ8353683.1 CarD family transcriptional regulator [Spirochaetaceae bacterium]
MSDFKFQVNQKVVYPSQGVGTIVEIQEQEFDDKKMMYYVIYIEVSDMTVMIPVNISDELGVRAIVSADKAQKALDSMGEAIEPVTSDWKQRYQMNLELLKNGTIEDIASIVRCLYHRSKIKDLPIQERKLYDSAKKLLEDEIAYALDKSPKEVEALIHAKLEPLGLMIQAKNNVHNDDDFDDDEEDVFIEQDQAEPMDDDDDDMDDD